MGMDDAPCIGSNSNLRGMYEEGGVMDESEIRKQYEKAMATAKEACGDITPSGGRTWVDELAGLLRVTRMRRDAAEKRLSEAGLY